MSIEKVDIVCGLAGDEAEGKIVSISPETRKLTMIGYVGGVVRLVILFGLKIVNM